MQMSADATTTTVPDPRTIGNAEQQLQPQAPQSTIGQTAVNLPATFSSTHVEPESAMAPTTLVDATSSHLPLLLQERAISDSTQDMHATACMLLVAALATRAAPMRSATIMVDSQPQASPLLNSESASAFADLCALSMTAPPPPLFRLSSESVGCKSDTYLSQLPGNTTVPDLQDSWINVVKVSKIPKHSSSALAMEPVASHQQSRCMAPVTEAASATCTASPPAANTQLVPFSAVGAPVGPHSCPVLPKWRRMHREQQLASIDVPEGQSLWQRLATALWPISLFHPQPVSPTHGARAADVANIAASKPLEIVRKLRNEVKGLKQQAAQQKEQHALREQGLLMEGKLLQQERDRTLTQLQQAMAESKVAHADVLELKRQLKDARKAADADRKSAVITVQDMQQCQHMLEGQLRNAQQQVRERNQRVQLLQEEQQQLEEQLGQFRQTQDELEAERDSALQRVERAEAAIHSQSDADLSPAGAAMDNGMYSGPGGGTSAVTHMTAAKVLLQLLPVCDTSSFEVGFGVPQMEMRLAQLDSQLKATATDLWKHASWCSPHLNAALRQAKATHSSMSPPQIYQHELLQWLQGSVLSKPLALLEPVLHFDSLTWPSNDAKLDVLTRLLHHHVSNSWNSFFDRWRSAAALEQIAGPDYNEQTRTACRTVHRAAELLFSYLQLPRSRSMHPAFPCLQHLVMEALHTACYIRSSSPWSSLHTTLRAGKTLHAFSSDQQVSIVDLPLLPDNIGIGRAVLCSLRPAVWVCSPDKGGAPVVLVKEQVVTWAKQAMPGGGDN